MTDLAWIVEAKKYLGTKEIPGVNHHPLILRMWKAIKRGGIQDDETPWCAAFVGFCLENVDIVSSRFESAKSYMSWGQFLGEPVYGCIAVFTREGGGHVGFCVGQTQNGDLLILGGNQGNEVNIRAFPRARASAYRWPTMLPLPHAGLDFMSSAPASLSEA